MRTVLLSVLMIGTAILGGCGPSPTSGGQGGAGGTGGAPPFAITSAAFAQGEAIPAEQQCTAISGGLNVSPPLTWTPGPAGTQSYAIVMKDVGLPFTHWVIWDIPSAVLNLPRGVENAFQPVNVTGAKALAKLGDVYVNDAFGAAHRAHASTAGIAKHVPQAAMGLLMEKELQYLEGELDNPSRPFVVILGGSKVSDKIGVIKALMEKADTFLIGGAMAYTFFKAQGIKTGKSRVEEDKLDLAT